MGNTESAAFVPLWEKSPEAIFATRLREIRQIRGLSQQEIANRLAKFYGIRLDATAVTRIEKNAINDSEARMIRLTEAVAIANVIGVRLNDMLHAALSIEDELGQARLELEACEQQADYSQHRVEEASRRIEILQRMIAEDAAAGGS